MKKNIWRNFKEYTETDKVYLAMEQALRLYYTLYKKYGERKRNMHKMGETIKELNNIIDRLAS